VTRLVAAVFAAAALCGFAGAATSATLRVTLDDRMTLRPTEGYVWFVGLDGRTRAVRGRVTTVLPGTAGRHLLTSFIRPCDGNCGYLDPPSHRCSLRVRLPARLTVRLRNAGCRITAG
jgi:hypothetical protein